MRIDDILSDEKVRQREFPVVRNKVFLAHAGVAPLPRTVASTINDYVNNATTGDQEILFTSGRMYEIRALAAKLIGATPEEIALVGPTSLGLSFVAAGLPFKPDDNVIIYYDDYPSNVYPWLALSEKGVEIRKINVSSTGSITCKDVLEKIDKNTRLVALPSCHFLSGWRLDIDEIGRELRNRGILFCVDAIQTLGAFPIDVKYIDFLAADAHKWLLGPCGAGIFYVRKELQNLLKPIVFGWHNVRCPGFIAQDNIVFQQDARRYECGTPPLALLAGLHSALELIAQLDVKNIAQAILHKRAILIKALIDKGYTVLHYNAPEKNSSGIISFTKDGTDMALLHKKLLENNIVTSLRMNRQVTRFIRLSPHFYNTEAEFERLLRFL